MRPVFFAVQQKPFREVLKPMPPNLLLKMGSLSLLNVSLMAVELPDTGIEYFIVINVVHFYKFN